jgi:outer membrane protein TolC
MNIVQTDVRQSLVQLLAAQGVVEEASRQLSKARDVAAGTQLQYSAGQTTLPLLLNAQTQRASAQTNFASASYSFLEAEQTYLYALGANDRQDGLTYGSR